MEKIDNREIDYSHLSNVEIADLLCKQRVFEIKDRFPAKDGEQLFDLITTLALEKDILRIPMLGVKDNEEKIRLFALADPIQSEHIRLYELLGEPKVVYTTGIEFISTSLIDEKPKFPFLSMPIKMKTEEEVNGYIKLSNGSDKRSFPRLTPEGRKKLSEVFNIPGVTFESWQN